METGSSPLTRGKPARNLFGDALDRLIPAHAGKTDAFPRAYLCPGAHPRSRGENSGVVQISLPSAGSSPLTRGKRPSVTPQEASRGLIPAHAGKTKWYQVPGGTKRAHPRSRGENEAHCLVPSGVYGSSPLTRGKPLNHGLQGFVDGLIPAHAGKTPRSRWLRGSGRAHPRSRGENFNQPLVLNGWQGSSPLTRGKRSQGSRTCLWGRLIPAHAGKTESVACCGGLPAAHPRSRGENPLA